MLMADPAIQENFPSSEGSKPIIVYYSRTGKTRIVANALKEQLTCEIAEIKSTEDREGFWGVITCVLDSLLDRDDIIEPFNKDLKGYNPIIIASPIWIGKLSSPARTFIKQAELKDKEVDIFLTYNGKLTEEKEKALEDKITSQGIELKCLYKIITKEKTEEEVQKEVITQLNERPILKKKADN
jgi:flavodoxin